MAAEGREMEQKIMEEEEEEEEEEEKKQASVSLSIWPPTERTREAVIKRLVKTLSTSSSLLSKRYVSLPLDEASSTARRIEQEAFSAVSISATSDADQGIEILHIYSKEISKRMLDAVKPRDPPPSPSGSAHSPSAPAPAFSEEISPIASESSHS